MDYLVQKYRYDELSNMIATIQKRLEEYHFKVDSLPKGMIKERFVGGITNLFNIAYLIKMNEAKKG